MATSIDGRLSGATSFVRRSGIIGLAFVAVTIGCSRDLDREIARLDPRCTRETLVDEEIVVGAGSWHFIPFAIKKTCAVTVSVKGLRDTGKGFHVNVTPGGAGSQLKKTGKFSYHPGFEGLKVRNYAATHDLPAGSHGVLVQNSENLLFSMATHVRVTTAPAQD